MIKKMLLVAGFILTMNVSADDHLNKVAGAQRIIVLHEASADVDMGAVESCMGNDVTIYSPRDLGSRVMIIMETLEGFSMPQLNCILGNIPDAKIGRDDLERTQ